MCDCKALSSAQVAPKEESDLLFRRHWPLLHQGMSFCWNHTQQFCRCVKDWNFVERCKRCKRTYHRSEEEEGKKDYCGRHRYMRPQMGVRDVLCKPPFWILQMWFIFVAILTLILTPTSVKVGAFSFVLDAFLSFIYHNVISKQLHAVFSLLVFDWRHSYFPEHRRRRTRAPRFPYRRMRRLIRERRRRSYSPTTDDLLRQTRELSDDVDRLIAEIEREEFRRNHQYQYQDSSSSDDTASTSSISSDSSFETEGLSRTARRTFANIEDRAREILRMDIDSDSDVQTVFSEQLGMRLPAFITPDFIARETTLLLALKTSITSSSDKSGVIAALVSYAQAHSQKSLLSHFTMLMKGNSGCDWNAVVSEHVNLLIEQDGEDEDKWLEDIKETLSNWRRYRHNKDAKNFLKLLNYAVSLGMCEASSLTFKMGKLKFFEPVVYKNQIDCLDLIDLVCTTAIGFIEGGWRVYKTGEVSAFFAHDEIMQTFETNYNRIRDIHGYSLTGNLMEHAKIAETDYEALLDKTITIGEKIAKSISRTMTIEKKFVMDRLDRIRDWRNEFVQVRSRGGLRKSPFAISLFGNTCVGKSTLNKLTYDAIGSYNNIDVSDERVATWADNDKYASNIRSSTNVIVFDDFGNTSPKFMDFSPVYRLIQTINNALFLAPMAEAFLKGKVALHPWIVMVTTNVEYLLAEQYSEKPESVLRRLFHVKVEVHEEFMTDGLLDTTKVKAKFGVKRDADIWKLTIRKCVVGMPKTTNSHKNQYELKPIKFQGRFMKNVDVYDYLRWAQIASRDHYDYQADLIERNMAKRSAECCKVCDFAFCGCKKLEEEESYRLPSFVDPEVHPDDDSVVGELNDLCHGLRTMFGNDGFEEQSSPVLRSALRFLLYYCVSFIFGLIISIILIILRIPSESHIPLIRFYAAWAKNYLISWRNQFQRWSMRNLYKFARWQLQQRWNIRAFFWRLRETRTEDLINLDNWYNDSIFDWVAWVPESLITSPYLTHLVLYSRRYEILNRKWKVLVLYWICYSGAACWFIKGWFVSSFIIFYSTSIAIATIWYYERRAVEQELLQRNNALPAYVKIFKQQSGKLLLGIGAFGLYQVFRWIYGMKQSFSPQGNLNPQNMEDVKERDSEPNMWATNYISPLPMSTASKTTTPNDLANLCCENLVYVESNKYFVRGFLIESNFMILPAHFVKKHWDEGHDDFSVRCWRRNPKVTGGNFRDMIARAYTYEIPKTDFVICWTPSAGSMCDLRKFLPTAAVSDSEAIFILKDKDGTSKFTKTFYNHSPTGIDHLSMKFIPGGTYKLPFDTAYGMCMSPLVSGGRGTTILGFHLCGEGRTGGCGYLTLDQVEQGLKHLAEIPGVVRTANQGTMPKEQFGTKLVEEGEVHRKSATRFLTEGCSIEVYGPTSGRATPHSSVIPTMISDIVTEVTGVPQKWGPPKMKGEGVYPYQAALEQLSHPSLSLGSIVEKAVRCYRMQFLKIRKKLPELFDECKPLTRVQTVSGIAGKRFIDAMNFNTSPGWPLSGKKTKLLIDLNPEDYPECGKPRTFVPEIWEEVDRTKSILLKRERAYCVWKACLKDEPTSLSKDKVRVFQSAPIVLQLLIRMYFLPIVRIIQLNPLMTECLVGANAEGPEWEQLNEFMNSKGKNVLAGDYSKYDQRMPAQLVTAAFSILIWVAEHLCEYPEDDIKLMKALVAEIVYPLMAYNGDLLMLFGSNPSGQNLTVVINSIVNSLLLRSCYYTKYPLEPVGSFTEFCAFGTYGDDVKGTVSEERPLFNHISFAEFLSIFDMKFTMPDKESVATAYMDADDADFLKRHNYYNFDLRAYVGILSEDSIFKRLHAHLTSQELTLARQAAQNIDTSLHDWFYYGREKFEFRLQQMKEVATRAGITHLCHGFDKSYDDRVQTWLRKYRPEDADPIEDSRITFRENAAWNRYVSNIFDDVGNISGSG